MHCTHTRSLLGLEEVGAKATAATTHVVVAWPRAPCCCLPPLHPNWP
jgi:hypothetical protein